MQRKVYPLLACNKENSDKANSKLAAMVYRNDLKMYGQPQSYSLLKNLDGYALSPNHELASHPHHKYIDLMDSIYSYVILQNEDGEPLLKIANGSHYYLANKSDHVIAAGEIHFNNNKIVKINDRSGTYSSNINMMSPDKRKEYLESIKEIFSDLDLPFDKYEFHKPISKQDIEKSNKSSSCWPKLFTRDVVIGTAASLVVAAAMYTYST